MISMHGMRKVSSFNFQFRQHVLHGMHLLLAGLSVMCPHRMTAYAGLSGWQQSANLIDTGRQYLFWQLWQLARLDLALLAEARGQIRFAASQ